MSRYRAATSTFAAAVLTLAGCGDGARQGAGEQAATYAVKVTEAHFPARQRVARQEEMRIAVKNPGREALGDVAVTVDSFSRRSEQPGLADAERPSWVVDKSPRGGTTASADTWTLTHLAPGRTKTFRWKLTPIEAGRYELRYTVAAGPGGRDRARRAASDAPVTGIFAVRVSRKPAAARVNPETGAVERVEEQRRTAVSGRSPAARHARRPRPRGSSHCSWRPRAVRSRNAYEPPVHSAPRA